MLPSKFVICELEQRIGRDRGSGDNGVEICHLQTGTIIAEK